jgi:hypothetical protein
MKIIINFFFFFISRFFFWRSIFLIINEIYSYFNRLVNNNFIKNELYDQKLE